MDRARPARALASGVAVALLGWCLVTPAWSEPTPTDGGAAPDPGAATSASPSAAPSSSPVGSAVPSPTPDAATSTGPTAPATAAPSAAPRPRTQVAEPAPAAPLTLAVASTGGPVAGAFYEDLGSFALTGTSTLADGTVVTLERRAGTTWTAAATATVSGGAYAASTTVGAAGPAAFRARGAGTEGAEVSSPTVTVTVRDSTISAKPVAKVDSLKAARVSGTVVPSRAGVAVVVDVKVGSAWKKTATATTAADGTWSTTSTYGTSRLQRYSVRASYRAANRPRWERSGSASFSRIAVLDARTGETSRADVAKTYRKGCPTGPSKLTTIHLNHYGFDKRMHRGVIIIRTDLRQEIVRGFGSALEHRYPIAKMRNPNAYGGNDPRQMKANNTSGFNCRKVVGNPYKTSPHSYGIALDVNTVQNPYRDVKGKWWPSNGKKYRDRTPLKKGMLGKKSWLTTSLRKDGFFWGGLWNPGRDYQHFEHRG